VHEQIAGGAAATGSEAPLPALADGEAELRENRKNRRRGLHRFIADADPARCASAWEAARAARSGRDPPHRRCVPACLAGEHQDLLGVRRRAG
jgi:hypothetical protein